MAEDFHHSSTNVKKEKKKRNQNQNVYVKLKTGSSSFPFFKKIKVITTSRFKLIHQIKLFIV